MVSIFICKNVTQSLLKKKTNYDKHFIYMIVLLSFVLFYYWKFYPTIYLYNINLLMIIVHVV